MARTALDLVAAFVSENQLNMDFDKEVAIAVDDETWVPSPAAGIERFRLEREAAESGHTTSIVRYLPGTSFPRHVHRGGEEYLVLEGVFSDESGDYGEGSYVRNHPGSSHAPFSKNGCVIFVKLCQMSSEERASTLRRSNDLVWNNDGVDAHGGVLTTTTLYQSANEHVQLEKLATGSALKPVTQQKGCELLLLAGDLTINAKPLEAVAWARIPAGESLSLSSVNGCTFWSKRGHLSTA